LPSPAANDCTALNYVVILSSAIVLYARHSIGYRLAGVVVAIPVIVVANAFRLVVTGISGTISRQVFDLVHEYIWVALFALLIFGMWKVWADRSFHLTWEGTRQGAVVLGSSSAIFAFLLAIMPVYGPLLASASSLFLKFMIADSCATITWIHSKMECAYRGGIYELPFALESFNVAVYAGLVLPLQRRGDWKTLRASLSGLLAALLVNVLLISSMASTIIAHGKGSVGSFLLIEKGLLVAVPFALRWIVSGGGKGKASG
jgi:exosortase/archaeosortase family protein